MRHKSSYRQTLFYCALLYCTLQMLQFFFFYKSKVWGNPALSKPIGAIFPTALAYFVSLCHILVIITIFQAFKLLLYLLWWSVISDFWCYYCNCFGRHEPHSCKTMNLINVVCVLTAPLTGHFPVSLPLLGHPYCLRHKNIETRPINSPAMASKRSNGRKSHTSLTLNQRLEVIKLSEEAYQKPR